MLSSSRAKPLAGSRLRLETTREKGGAAVASATASTRSARRAPCSSGTIPLQIRTAEFTNPTGCRKLGFACNPPYSGKTVRVGHRAPRQPVSFRLVFFPTISWIVTTTSTGVGAEYSVSPAGQPVRAERSGLAQVCLRP
jgi:hypothetical protein